MKKILMPSQKKAFKLGGGWFAKEAANGARGLYQAGVFAPRAKNPSWEDVALAIRAQSSLLVAGGATVYSDAWTLARAGRRHNPNIAGGRQRALYWEFLSLPVGNIGDVLVCGKMFKGERFVGGLERHSALTSGGGTATGAVGTYAVATDGITLGAIIDVDEYLAAADWEAAAGSALGATVALSFGLVSTADQFLCVTNTTEAFATAGTVMGVVNLLAT